MHYLRYGSSVNGWRFDASLSAIVAVIQTTERAKAIPVTVQVHRDYWARKHHSHRIKREGQGEFVIESGEHHKDLPRLTLYLLNAPNDVAELIEAIP